MEATVFIHIYSKYIYTNQHQGVQFRSVWNSKPWMKRFWKKSMHPPLKECDNQAQLPWDKQFSKLNANSGFWQYHLPHAQACWQPSSPCLKCAAWTISHLQYWAVLHFQERLIRMFLQCMGSSASWIILICMGKEWKWAQWTPDSCIQVDWRSMSNAELLQVWISITNLKFMVTSERQRGRHRQDSCHHWHE